MDQACEAFACIGPVRWGCQTDVHRTNQGLWDGSLARAIPGQALIQQSLNPPADPLHMWRSQVSVHQPLTPDELRMGGIQKHVVASSNGAVDGLMEEALQYSPWALHIFFPPQLFPQRVVGDHLCAEQWCECRGDGGLPTARGADQQMPMWWWFRQRIVCRATALAHQLQERDRTWGPRNRSNRGGPRSFHRD